MEHSDLSLLLTVTILLLKQLCWSVVYKLTDSLVYSLDGCSFLHTLSHVMNNFLNYVLGNSRDPLCLKHWIWECPKGFCCTWILFFSWEFHFRYLSDLYEIMSSLLLCQTPLWSLNPWSQKHLVIIFTCLHTMQINHCWSNSSFLTGSGIVVELLKLAGGAYILPLLVQFQLKWCHLLPQTLEVVSYQDFMTERFLFH